MTRFQGIRKGRAPDLGDIVFRSSWERNFARILKLWEKRRKILAWFYEVDRFTFPIKRGTKSYLPDFKIFEFTGKHYYFEVKGWMDDKSKTRLKRFTKYYPYQRLDLVDRAEYKRYKKRYKPQIPEWEKDGV